MLFVTASSLLLMLDQDVQNLFYDVHVGDDRTKAIATDPVTSMVYVASSGDGTVSALEGINDTVIGTIPVGARSVAVVIDPVDGRVYIGIQDDASVSMIDTRSNTVISTVGVDEFATVPGCRS